MGSDFDAEQKAGRRRQTARDDIFNNAKKYDEYRKQLANSSELIEFVTSQTKYIERTLGEKEIIALFTAYDNVDEVDEAHKEDKDEDAKDNEEEVEEIKIDQREKLRNIKNPLSSLGVFYDESIVFKRAVTDLEWSTKFPELMLAGYSKSDEANINDPHGLVLLWSLGLRKKPEYQFTCQSELTKVILHPFNPKLIVGATHTGQIIVWDTRGKALPVMKTPPGGKYHSHPIYCLALTGTSSNSNIVSISNDGILCTWSPNNLTKATKRIELKAKKRRLQNQDLNSTLETGSVSTTKSTPTPYSDEFGVISMTTQESDANNMFIGTDDSDVFQITTHQK